VKELGKKDRTLKKDNIVITGAIGKFMDGNPGKYEAKFTQLGNIKFTLNE